MNSNYHLFSGHSAWFSLVLRCIKHPHILHCLVKGMNFGHDSHSVYLCVASSSEAYSVVFLKKSRGLALWFFPVFSRMYRL
jgi:hypothetical protein